MKNLTVLATITALVLSSTSAFAGSVGNPDIESEPIVNNDDEPVGSGLGTAGIVLAGVALLAIAAAASDGGSSSDH